uniref:NUC153 domain-containing protein n=1 Tax=Mesocestoides corti TaxID=53468 RepID=A0A5K3FR19_MESCO
MLIHKHPTYFVSLGAAEQMYGSRKDIDDLRNPHSVYAAELSADEFKYPQPSNLNGREPPWDGAVRLNATDSRETKLGAIERFDMNAVDDALRHGHMKQKNERHVLPMNILVTSLAPGNLDSLRMLNRKLYWMKTQRKRDKSLQLG